MRSKFYIALGARLQSSNKFLSELLCGTLHIIRSLPKYTETGIYIVYYFKL